MLSQHNMMTDVVYGCSFVAKFRKWHLYAKKINFRCSANDFFYGQQNIFIFNE